MTAILIAQLFINAAIFGVLLWGGVNVLVAAPLVLALVAYDLHKWARS